MYHGGEHALAEFNPAGEHGDLARRREIDPPSQLGIGVKLCGQGSVHYFPLVRMTAAAFSIARMIRLCEPQRQILPSSASAISLREGFGFSSSSDLADIRISGKAISALAGLLFEKGLLKRMRPLSAA